MAATNFGFRVYHLNTDPAEQHNLASQKPDRTARMIDQWEKEASRTLVFPTSPRRTAALFTTPPPSKHALTPARLAEELKAARKTA